jgi:hypothetical protein
LVGAPTIPRETKYNSEIKNYIYIKIKVPGQDHSLQETDHRHGSWTGVGNREDLGVKAVGKMCNTTGRQKEIP